MSSGKPRTATHCDGSSCFGESVAASIRMSFFKKWKGLAIQASNTVLASFSLENSTWPHDVPLPRENVS